MVIEQRFTPSRHGHSAGTARRARPSWGYLSRAVSRYGVVSSELVIYSPDAPERDRRWAEASRTYGAVAAGGALLAWIGFAAAGVSPMVAILAIAAVAVVVGLLLARRTRAVRRGAARVSACGSALLAYGPDHDARRRLDALADAMLGASLAYRSGALDEEGFDRVWRAVYTHARS
ncbi:MULTISPECIES: DUF6611 family protein [unclassified Microbacterium]|uniref:DUF6611 family protein n=1 Tax=unclassified Microbacterium TaxID=2609290 RepID=UPI00364FC842